ncbi:protein argonaute-2 [Folsomia candida]|uniref:Protein argonaute-2 n=1 Tax=Folsomia candida TaxID=158441 RepID=A0A226CXG2_FOLCA|nr:protein argonaute-2 [Folsomia candida]XP_021967192.1 protein argonaute-2 [Folsomia candida]OXA37659.1 Protein argonaute-2 [Folsomia candida]OXA37669.1 Protein argonaute-2 [Folsomia candida]
MADRVKELTKQMDDVRMSSPVKKRPHLPLTEARPLRVKGEPRLDVKKISIVVNHYPVTFERNFPQTLYHYDAVIENVEIISSDPTAAAAAKKRKDAQVLKAAKEGREMAGLPDRMLPIIWKEFETQCQATLRATTPFDGKKNVYTARRLELPNGDAFTATFDMDDPDDPDKRRRFRVTIKLVATVATNSVIEFLGSGLERGKQVVQPQDVIQGLDVALRHPPSMHFISCNRSFFNPFPQNRHPLDSMLELLHGHYQSLCLGSENTATLNIDLATKAFYKQTPLADFARSVLKLHKDDSLDLVCWDDRTIDVVSEALRGKLIKYGTGRCNQKGVYEKYHQFTANGLILRSAENYEFNMTDEKGITRSINIVQYMQKFKNTTIRFPKWPVVHIGNKNMTNYVPLELCMIITQPYRGKMEPKLTSAMIKGAAIEPVARFKAIDQARKGSKFETSAVMSEFGMSIGQTPIVIRDASVIPPPTVKTLASNGAEVNARMTFKEGKWNFKDSGSEPSKKFLKAATLPKWMIFDCDGVLNDEIIAENFIKKLIELGESLGMKGFRIPGKPKPTIKCYTEATFHPGKIVGTDNKLKRINRAFDIIKKMHYELVIVVLPSDGKDYAFIKAEAEVVFGILTACIKSSNVRDMNNQKIGNYLLKLNSKLSGTNFSIQQLNELYFKERTMILGADVTHPSPNSMAPSIAAVTASFNMSCMGYSMHIQPQKSRQELIKNMGDILEKQLTKFFETNRAYPTRILMFRDGVSEGYFDEVKAEEYAQMRDVCEFTSEKFGIPKIKITFVIVKKRHHTRFQPTNATDGVGKFYNIPPGTVVDTKIVHPSEREFFLNSHVGIQGTSKPTRYHVIHDDTNFTMGDLQKITYYLCYAFVRCTQPVSYPAATYYAHLAAYRARHLLEREGENADLVDLAEKLTIHPDLAKRYPMFFV